jgi:uncharacterized protein (DUF2147 family)
MTKWITCLMICVGLTTTPSRAANLDVAGLWLTADRDGQVEIRDCGDNTPCGKLVWYDPAKQGGPLDTRNQNPSLRRRSVMHVPIFWGFSRSGGAWTGGNIYNPKTGQTFRSKLRLNANGDLIVSGCRGPFCITRPWTRVKK